MKATFINHTFINVSFYVIYRYFFEKTLKYNFNILFEHLFIIIKLDALCFHNIKMFCSPPAGLLLGDGRLLWDVHLHGGSFSHRGADHRSTSSSFIKRWLVYYFMFLI